MYCITCKMEVRVQDMGEKEKRTKRQAGDAEVMVGLGAITWCYFAWISEGYIYVNY